ncbi:hypothetical protein JR316_0009501 [Psilocybe cubensis]|uniref:Uncharacterized protein n=2 Tax=Psilocybe cubensis TaxID=181762 RepID=A0ACB8GPK4_PSICU|nr:hypothetical protein JR316_0009501 [Psilocybe cubensis]KAH9477297.1 hypothetical protein JR316_0009501 [Psilocybe cubensis]
MFANFTKLFVTLATLAVAASASPAKRQEDLADCTFLLKADGPIDQTDLTAIAIEFNYVLGRSLAVSTGTPVNGGAAEIITASYDNVFNVHKTLSAEGKTSAETAAVVEGWVGETKLGLSANWLVQAAECA